jgi:drug/metabolite transporter (DMT)-like permease
MDFIGELAGLATAVSISFGSTLFTLSGRRIGSVVLNRVRLLFAVAFLCISHWIFIGMPFPVYTEPDRWLWLGLSGIVGLVIGDYFLFQAFVWIGPSLSMLMMSLTPVIAAFQAWIFLGEVVTFRQTAGILMTLSGIAWVVMSRSTDSIKVNRDYGRGILFGFLGAIGQASGMVLAKNGLTGNFSPISANLIRMISAAVMMWLITCVRREGKSTLQKVIRNRRGALYALMGAFAGPFLGISLSMVAIQNTKVGIASTLMALPPVFLLPISYFVFNERYSWGAVLGTILAIAGIAMIFLL